jgi:flavin-dependent dehydrogenase
MTTGTIRILGGGISGLTAAINLKKAGFDVEVHERKTYCGKHTQDFQFLENWTFRESALDFLGKINISTDFYLKPWCSLEIFSPSLKRHVAKSTRPFLYLVKRGQTKDSIDRSLEDQAKNQKVKIFYRSALDSNEASIIATGPKRPSFIATGTKFKFVHPDQSVILFDTRFSLKFYSYLIVNDDIGEIVCVNPAGTTDFQTRLHSVIEAFERILKVKIEKVEESFFDFVNFDLLQNARIHDQWFIGEAAGFHDFLAGFGMVYAFRSGYLVAKSIIEGLDFDTLWKKDFSKPLRISSMNRAFYERMSNDHFERIIQMLNSRNFIVRRLRGGDDFQLIMKKLYSNSIPFLLRHLIFK